MDNVDIFYGLLVYITDIWSILQLFSKFCGNLVYFMYGNLVYFLYGNLVYFMYGNLVYFFPFWYVVPRKIWQTLIWLFYRKEKEVFRHLKDFSPR
jgi:hypothetical protein